MGLYSDYLEECRVRTKEGELDPCMIMGSTWSGRGHYNSYYTKLHDYHQKDITISDKNKIRNELLKKSLELEKLKSGYLVAEKAILEIENHHDFSSQLVQDTIKLFREQLHDSYIAICELRQKIDKELGNPPITAFESASEAAIRAHILKRLINCIIFYMEEGVVSDTASCRRVVTDCAEIIRRLEQEKYIQPDKEVLSYYLERKFNIRKVQHQCRNCHQYLYYGIPYCLNCYERNI